MQFDAHHSWLVCALALRFGGDVEGICCHNFIILFGKRTAWHRDICESLLILCCLSAAERRWTAVSPQRRAPRPFLADLRDGAEIWCTPRGDMVLRLGRVWWETDSGSRRNQRKRVILGGPGGVQRGRFSLVSTIITLHSFARSGYIFLGLNN